MKASRIPRDSKDLGWIHIFGHGASNLYQDGRKVDFVTLGGIRYEVANQPEKLDVWLRPVPAQKKAWEDI
jgi:hypothetical protein